ncbi:hypothetical protein ACLOJK_034468, partial [Asimina triloba]
MRLLFDCSHNRFQLGEDAAADEEVVVFKLHLSAMMIGMPAALPMLCCDLRLATDLGFAAVVWDLPMIMVAGWMGLMSNGMGLIAVDLPVSMADHDLGKMNRGAAALAARCTRHDRLCSLDLKGTHRPHS